MVQRPPILARRPLSILKGLCSLILADLPFKFIDNARNGRLRNSHQIRASTGNHQCGPFTCPFALFFLPFSAHKGLCCAAERTWSRNRKVVHCLAYNASMMAFRGTAFKSRQDPFGIYSHSFVFKAVTLLRDSRIYYQLCPAAHIWIPIICSTPLTSIAISTLHSPGTCV
jgi:hypothetical protein